MEWHLTAGGHRDRDATVGKIKERCQRNAPQLKAELQPVAVEPQVWYLVGMDLTGPFSTNCRWAQVCANHDRLLQQVC